MYGHRDLRGAYEGSEIRQENILQERWLAQHGYKSIFSWTDRFWEHCRSCTKPGRRKEYRVTGEAFHPFVKEVYD